MTSVDARDDLLHELDVPAVGNKDLHELCVAILNLIYELLKVSTAVLILPLQFCCSVL
jgi:hypothetical protein